MNYKEKLEFTEDNDVEGNFKELIGDNMIEKAKVLNEKRKFFKKNRVSYIDKEVYRNIIKLPRDVNTIKDEESNNNKEDFVVTNLDVPIYSNLFKNVKNFRKICGLSIDNHNYNRDSNSNGYGNSGNSGNSLTLPSLNLNETNTYRNISTIETVNTNTHKYLTPYQKQLHIKESIFKDMKYKLKKQNSIEKYNDSNNIKEKRVKKISFIPITKPVNTDGNNNNQDEQNIILPKLINNSNSYRQMQDNSNNNNTINNKSTSSSSRRKFLSQRLQKLKIAEILQNPIF